MLTDPRHDMTVLKSDSALLSDVIHQCFFEETHLSIRYAPRKNRLVLDSKSIGFLDRFCNLKGFDNTTLDENMNSTSTCPKVLKTIRVPAESVDECRSPYTHNAEASPCEIHSNSVSANDWRILSKMLEMYVSQDSFLSIKYEEIIHSLVITSKYPDFVYTNYKERWLEKLTAVKGNIVSNNGIKTPKASNNPINRPTKPAKNYNCNSKTNSDRYVNALSNNDNATVQEIFKIYFPAISRMVLQKKGTINDADDIFYEALADLCEDAKAGKLKLVKEFGGFLYATCRNKWHNHYKKANKTVFIEFEDVSKLNCFANPFQEAEEFAEMGEFIQFFSESFETLPARYKQSVNLWLLGKSWKQVSSILNITPSCAKKYKCEAVKRQRTSFIQSPKFTSDQKLIIRSRSVRNVPK